jgi:hypothetical protein
MAIDVAVTGFEDDAALLDALLGERAEMQDPTVTSALAAATRSVNLVELE